MTDDRIEQELKQAPATGLPDQAREVAALAATIHVGSIASVLAFGAGAVNEMNQITDQVLQRARASDLGETGEQLTQIVLTAQEFDFDQLDNPWGRIPLIGGLLKQLNASRARTVAKFETVKTQIDRLVETVERTAQRLTTRDAEYAQMYERIRHEYDALGLHVTAIRERLNQVDTELAGSPQHPGDMLATERAAVLEAARVALSKRGDDLEAIRHAAMQTLPMIRIIQSNNYAIVDKLATIRTLTLPAWKRAFMMAISIAEQKEANDLAVTIDDATNSLMRRNAELLRQNSVAVAKSSQRLVIDVATLRSVHTSVIATLAEVRQVHTDGAAERAAALKELGTLRDEFAIAVRDTAKRAA